MTADNPLKKLSADELLAVAAPLHSTLQNISAGDGSLVNVTGHGAMLAANLFALLPTLQKIGVVNIATYLDQALAAFVLNHAQDPTTTITNP